MYCYLYIYVYCTYNVWSVLLTLRETRHLQYIVVADYPEELFCTVKFYFLIFFVHVETGQNQICFYFLAPSADDLVASLCFGRFEEQVLNNDASIFLCDNLLLFYL